MHKRAKPTGGRDNYFKKHALRTNPFPLFSSLPLYLLTPLYLPHLNPLFSDLISIYSSFSFSFPTDFVSLTHAFFLLCLVHDLFSSIADALCANWYYSGTPHACIYARCTFPRMMCIRARSNVHVDVDANACTRGGSGNQVNFDEDGTYW